MTWGRWHRIRRQRAMQRVVLRRMWAETGALYGADWDAAEALRLRWACEELGEVPMGYGRVGRKPEQLNADFGDNRREGSTEHDD